MCDLARTWHAEVCGRCKSFALAVVLFVWVHSTDWRGGHWAKPHAAGTSCPLAHPTTSQAPAQIVWSCPDGTGAEANTFWFCSWQVSWRSTRIQDLTKITLQFGSSFQHLAISHLLPLLLYQFVYGLFLSKSPNIFSLWYSHLSEPCLCGVCLLLL